MEKTVQRVQKRTLMLLVLTIVLSSLTLSGESVNFDKSIMNYEITAFDMDKTITDQINEMQLKKLSQLQFEQKLKKLSIQKNDNKEEQQWEDFLMTHYVSNCYGCSGFTYTEYDVRNTTMYENYHIIAVDKNVIELGSIVEIDDNGRKFKAIAIDIGGAIKGKKIDLLVGSVKEAYRLGKKEIKLKVERYGWGDEKKKIDL